MRNDCFIVDKNSKLKLKTLKLKIPKIGMQWPGLLFVSVDASVASVAPRGVFSSDTDTMPLVDASVFFEDRCMCAG